MNVAREDEVLENIDKILESSGYKVVKTVLIDVAFKTSRDYKAIDDEADLAELENFFIKELRNQAEDAAFSQSHHAAPTDFTKPSSSNDLTSSANSSNPLLLILPSSLTGSSSPSITDYNLPSMVEKRTPTINSQPMAPNQHIDDPNNSIFEDLFQFESEITEMKLFDSFFGKDSLFDLARIDSLESNDMMFAGVAGYQDFGLFGNPVVEPKAISKPLDSNLKTCVHLETTKKSPDQSSKNSISISEPCSSEVHDSESSGDLVAESSVTVVAAASALKNKLTATRCDSLGLARDPETSSECTTVDLSDISGVPRASPSACGLPITFSKQIQIDLIRGLIATLSKIEYKRLAAQFSSFVHSASNKPSNRGKKRSSRSKAKVKAEKNRVSKVEKVKSPRKKKRQFDYTGISIQSTVFKFSRLQNNAKNYLLDTHDYKRKLIALSDQEDCVINRTRYHRGNVDVLNGLYHDVSYERNPLFNNFEPYQQEFTRVELDPVSKLPLMETRCALCVYCEDIHFYELKNSSYSQHMSHSHGIFPDGYMSPNPLFIGQYRVAKKPSAGRKTQARTRSHEGVVCPACFEIVEVRCWSSTSVKKPLANYLRHFKEIHRIDKNKDSYFSTKA